MKVLPMCETVHVRKLTCCRKADCLPEIKKKDIEHTCNYSFDPTNFDEIVNISSSYLVDLRNDLSLHLSLSCLIHKEIM